MKLTIFGGTGKTGLLLVKQALAAGHSITALVRNPDKLTITDPNLRVVHARLDDQKAIEMAVDGSDAIVSVFGPTEKTKDRPLTRGVNNIIEAMKKTGVRRYIQVATPSNVDPSDGFDFKISLSRLLIRTIASSAYHEICGYGDLVRNSGLDWTLVRVPWLKDGDIAPVKNGYVGSGDVGLGLTRASMVAFILEELEAGRFIQKAPAISN